MVSEIAEYVGCDASAVWCAVRNEAHDDTDEDQAYIDGQIGDVVDFEALDGANFDCKMEEMEDVKTYEADRKPDNGSFVESDEDVPFWDAVEFEDHETVEGMLVPSSDGRDPRLSRSSSLSSLTSLNESEHDGLANFQCGSEAENIIPQPVSTPGPIAIQNPSHSTFTLTPTASTTAADCHLSSEKAGSSSSAVNDGTPSLQEPRKPSDSVKTFLDNLERPCGHLLPYFLEMELDTEENLDDLCRMGESMWEDVKVHLLGKGVTLFRWLIIKNGLKNRAACLASS